MTKEALRQRLMQGRGGSKSLEESMLESCMALQIEMQEANAEVILNMSSMQFDMMIAQITRRYEAQTGKPQRKGVGVFG